MLDKHEIARALRDIGLLLEAKGENPFKVRAYETAARALEAVQGDLGRIVDEGRLTSIPGIGVALALKITELYRDGRSSLLEQLRAEMPRGYVELLRVPDLGPKRVRALYEALGIHGVTDLESAAREGRIQAVKGFSAKLEAKILAGLAAMKQAREQTLLVDALDVGGRYVAYLSESPAVHKAELAGSARRRRETVADLDIVVATLDAGAVMDRFVRFPDVVTVDARGDTKCTVHLVDGVQVDLRVVSPEDWATALHHFTGSKAHHVKVRGRARERGLTVSEWGLHTIDGNKKIPVGTEAELYARLDLPYIPPELREDEGEIEAAQAGDRFTDLIELADLQGMVHVHTTWSDGRDSIEAMARAAEALGMRYLTITDHSPTAGYANGLDVSRIASQWDEIDEVQERVSIRLLKGAESDILEDGALDYPASILERLDVVIASVHNRYKLDSEAMTERLVRTMREPVFKIWGHALGRLLDKRPPIDCHVEAVLDAIAESRACIEINGDPHRLDLEPRWVREARKRGIKFVISSDAHSIGGLSAIEFGVAMARRGHVRRGEVLNALPVDAFRAAVRPAVH